jgi:adenosylcobinamide-GDP ribazoletransferase
MDQSKTAEGRGLLGWYASVLAAIGFFSRIPVPASCLAQAPDMNRLALILPLAALVIISPAMLCLALTGFVSVTGLEIALALVINMIVTGALHDDGLADVADGFFGGATRERRLEIMRDSRLGTFGVLALIGAFALRFLALLSLSMTAGLLPMLGCFAIAAMLSRSFSLFPLWLLPPARADGAGASALPPSRLSLGGGLALSLVLSLLIIWQAGIGMTSLGLAPLGLVLFCAGLALAAMVALAKRKIGGHTGDVCGATQQVTDLAILVGFAAFLK